MARDLSVGWCGMVRVAGENCGNPDHGGAKKWSFGCSMEVLIYEQMLTKQHVVARSLCFGLRLIVMDVVQSFRDMIRDAAGTRLS